MGGVGGIGRSIAKWMVQRGAKHLVLLSRSAASTDETVTSFVESLRYLGADIGTEACDVSNEAQLIAALERVRLQRPPIRGVIQAAMVLRVSMEFSSRFLALLEFVSSQTQCSCLLL